MDLSLDQELTTVLQQGGDCDLSHLFVVVKLLSGIRYA